MVTRTRHNFTLYVHFLSRSIIYAIVRFVETECGVWYVRLCRIQTVRMMSLIFSSFLIASIITNVYETCFTELLFVFITLFLMMDAVFFVEASRPDYAVTRHVPLETSPQPRGLDHMNTRKMSRSWWESNQRSSTVQTITVRCLLPLHKLLRLAAALSAVCVARSLFWAIKCLIC
jgi:hypothetical protein